jgi:hypothetical protein
MYLMTSLTAKAYFRVQHTTRQRFQALVPRRECLSLVKPKALSVVLVNFI